MSMTDRLTMKNRHRKTIERETAKIKNIHIVMCIKNHMKMQILWINYLPSKDSPIFTTSPAPIVINRSPSEQFSKIKFSMSSNSGK